MEMIERWSHHSKAIKHSSWKKFETISNGLNTGHRGQWFMGEQTWKRWTPKLSWGTEERASDDRKEKPGRGHLPPWALERTSAEDVEKRGSGRCWRPVGAWKAPGCPQGLIWWVLQDFVKLAINTNHHNINFSVISGRIFQKALFPTGKWLALHAKLIYLWKPFLLNKFPKGWSRRIKRSLDTFILVCECTIIPIEGKHPLCHPCLKTISYTGIYTLYEPVPVTCHTQSPPEWCNLNLTSIKTLSSNKGIFMYTMLHMSGVGRTVLPFPENLISFRP